MNDTRPPLLRTVALGLCLLAAVGSSVQAASPSLGAIQPWGGQRGTELEVVFSGDRLADAQDLVIYQPGLSVASLEAVDEKSVKVNLAIAPDCRLGNHGLRVRTATGISNLLLFSVGAMPEASEAEPNNEFEQPQTISLDTTINGVVQSEDVDHFVIEAKQGQRITAEIEGIRLGRTFFDPYVAILDERRFELDSTDDNPLVWQDAVASVVAPADGKYIVQVRESAFGGNGNCVYRLHVGQFPRPAAVLPSGGQPGEELEVRFVGDVNGEFTQTVKLPAEPLAEFGLHASDDLGLAPSPNVFRLGSLPNVLEAEPNHAPAEATPFTVPAALGGAVGEAGQTDYFKFAGTKGQVLDVRVFARQIRSPLDSVLSIHQADGKQLAANDDSGGPDSYLRFTVPEDGEYLVAVRDHLGKGGPTYAYRIEVAPVAAALTMGLPERSQFVDITAPVPRGNRFAFLVSAARADFGGDLNIAINDLPPGVTVETFPMPANHTTVPVLLTAEAEAPLGGALIDIVGSHTDPNTGISGRLVQNTSLVRGQNNVRMWDHSTQRLAAGVTEAVPFTLEIVQPQVPLVRGGNMNLRVVAHREEGFTAPIAIRMLYDPSGVGSSGSISIPEGQNEATIPLNANGNAETRVWKIAVVGEATVGNGPVTVSTQLADLEVAEPYFAFEFQPSAVEKGQQTEVVVNVTTNHEYEEGARVELLGLPNEVTAEPLDLTAATEELVFKVNTTANSPAGKHTTLLCRAIITRNDEPITHMIGSGELRIDEPLPPKADAPAAPAPMPEQVAEKPPERRLTRLEQLRLERKQAKESRQAQAAAADSTEPAAPMGEGG